MPTKKKITAPIVEEMPIVEVPIVEVPIVEDDEDDEIEKLRIQMLQLQKKKNDKLQKKNEDILKAIYDTDEYKKYVDMIYDLTTQLDNAKKQQAEYVATEKEKQGFKQPSTIQQKAKQATTTDSVKEDIKNGLYEKYGLVRDKNTYTIGAKGGFYFIMEDDMINCGKDKTPTLLNLKCAMDNKINSLNKLGIFVYGCSTNIYTKLILI